MGKRLDWGLKGRRVFRNGNTRSISNFDLREEAVTATRNCFDKPGTLGGIAQDVTDFIDCFVEPVVEIHKSVRGP